MLMSREVEGVRAGSQGVAWSRGDGDGGDGGDGGVPTTLPSGQTPGPSRPGTKYPVQGIPHFDDKVCFALNIDILTHTLSLLFR